MMDPAFSALIYGLVTELQSLISSTAGKPQHAEYVRSPEIQRMGNQLITDHRQPFDHIDYAVLLHGNACGRLTVSRTLHTLFRLL